MLLMFRLFSNTKLHVRSSNRGLMFLRGTLSEQLKRNLLTKITSIFGDLRPRADGEESTFTSIHFDFYNRYSTNGKNAPCDVHPQLLTKEGLKRAQSSLFIPRPSTEIKKFPRQYELLKECFQDVFEELHMEIETALPKEYKIEGIFAEFLPGDEPSPVFPFRGIVVNLNVQTIIH
ncbi:hypothetical protein HGRIS_003330 [Hohenbuehelia grisea]|uniref:Uncharacterized protein n=1 Tax=Hohenbuehelia grisea TaxID=104357 RepID=A0ABR3JFZ1_9AGAR